MEKESSRGLMVDHTKAIMLTIRRKDGVFTFGKTDENMMVNG